MFWGSARMIARSPMGWSAVLGPAHPFAQFSWTACCQKRPFMSFLAATTRVVV